MESIASNGDGEDENGMDDKDGEAEVVEEEANPSTAPPSHSGNLLQSFDRCGGAGEKDDEGRDSSSFLLNDDEEN